MSRLFIGTFLADDESARLSRIAAANRHLDSLWLKKIRWVAGDKLHLTWMFLGELDASATADLVRTFPARMAGLRKDKIAVTTVLYDRLALWPSSRKLKTGVLTSSEVPHMVQDIESLVRANLKDVLPAEERRKRDVFLPHITIFRVGHSKKGEGEREPVRPEVEAIHLEDEALPVVQTIDEVCLIESDMGKQIRGYVRLSSIQLHSR